MEQTSERNRKIIAYRLIQNNQAKVFAYVKDDFGKQGKIDQGKMQINSLQKYAERLGGIDKLLEIDKSKPLKAYLIHKGNEQVIYVDSTGKMKTVSKAVWKRLMMQNRGLVVNYVDCFGNIDEYVPTPVIGTIGNVKVGQFQLKEVSPGIYEGYIVTHIDRLGNIKKSYFKIERRMKAIILLEYVIQSDTVYIPPICQYILKDSLFLCEDGQTPYNADNSQKQVKYIRTTNGSRLISWRNTQFQGTGIIEIDFWHSNNLMNIGPDTFRDCGILRKVYINPKSKDDQAQLCIDDRAFKDSIRLSTINLSKVKKIGEEQFMGTYQLKNINNTQSIEELGDRCFYKSGISGLLCLSNTIQIGMDAIQNCDDLEELVISVKDRLNPGTIQSNYKLRTLKITSKTPENGVELCTKSICNNTQLKSVEIPKQSHLRDRFITDQYDIEYLSTSENNYDTVQKQIILDEVEIDSEAFQDFKHIESIQLSRIINKIDDKIFSGLSRLNIVKIDGNTYIPDIKQNKPLHMQLKFCRDSGYTDDKEQVKEENTLTFISSTLDDNIILAKFIELPVIYQMWIVYDNGVMKAMQVLDTECKNSDTIAKVAQDIKLQSIDYKL